MHGMNTQRNPFVTTNHIDSGIGKERSRACLSLRAVDVRLSGGVRIAVIGNQMEVNGNTMLALTNFWGDAALQSGIELRLQSCDVV